MLKSYLTILFLFFLIGCENTVSLDNVFSISGFIYNKTTIPVDSAIIEIKDMEASKNHPSLATIGTITYSNKQGYYYTGVPCGTTWIENSVSGEKTYKKYIKSITILVSNSGYLDTLITVSADNLEETNKTLDIIISSK